MSYITANGVTVSEARIVSSLTGAWHVDLFAQSGDAITGAVTVDLAGTLSLKGTVIAGGPYVESLYLRVVAGKGGWSSPCSPKFYQGAALGTILADLLAQGGEALSTTSDASARAVVLGAFASTSGTVGANVRALMAYAPAGTSWRFLADGTFWIGPETWPAFGEDYQVTNEDPTNRLADVGFDVPTLLAGQSIAISSGVAHVNHVETSISAKAMTARAWWQS